MRNPKEEAKTTLLALKAQLAKPALTEIERLTAITYCDFALKLVEQLAVARPRKAHAPSDV